MAKRPSPDNASSSKRFRAAIDESIDELLCPITQSLPLDPVFADDGKVYERTAIEEWSAKQQRSPVTNLPMGTKVVAATPIKAMIERMVKSDALPEDKVRDWKKRITEQEHVEKTRRAADAGDATSALKMAKWLESGLKGCTKDQGKAFAYNEKAAEAGNACAMGRLCRAYQVGKGVGENKVKALRWAGAAAALGDPRGMAVLASLYGEGMPGLPADKGQEFKWKVKAEKHIFLNSHWLYNLATMYAEGQGIAVDMKMAEVMMRKAIRKGSKDTEAYVERARAWLASRGLPPVVGLATPSNV